MRRLPNLWNSGILSRPRCRGHCIPVDPFYLSWKARRYDFCTRFIGLAGEINIQVSDYVVKSGGDFERKGKPVRGSKVFVLGVTYKKHQ